MDNSPVKKRNIFLRTYEKHYKSLMIISMMILLFSIGVVLYTVATTGDFVNKGITLKGGLTLSVNTAQESNPDEIQKLLSDAYPKSDINVRSYGEFGSYGFVVEASDLNESQIVGLLKQKFPELKKSDYSSEATGSSLGNAFFVQTLKALFVAFIFMSLVIYLYFGHSLKLKWLTGFLSIVAGMMMFYADSTIMYIIPVVILLGLIVLYFKDNIPSFGIILCAFSDLLFSLAIFNLFGLKLNTAGVAAFLMLVGYSIDTDILLSVRVLKRKEGTVFDRTMDAMKTGITMSLAALVAVLTAYFLTSSSVVKEIMFILAVGLVGDILFTWIQNAGILRWHLEKKGWK
jgi:preprotein translocase subunit SecF